MINHMQEVIQRCIPLVWDESLSYVEALAKMLAKINEIIAALGTASDGLADIYLQITVIREGEGGDLPSLEELQAALDALWAAIAAMKGTGWTTENLVSLQDQVDVINGQLEGVDAALDYILNGGT